MPSLTNLLIVSVVAFAAPFLLGLFPSVRLPSVILEIVAAIVIGPSVLGIVEPDQAIAVIALIGLTFVLFLAGLEIDFRRLRGGVLRLTALAFALSFGVAVAVSLGLKAAGLVDTPLLVAIILCATSLGVLVPVLKDADEIASTFGQLIIAAASIADFGAIILLTIFFSGEGGTGSTLLLLGSLFALAAAVFVVVRGAERSARIRADLLCLQDTPETGGPEPISTDMLRRHAAEMQNVVQFSPPAPVAADSADAALELVFDQLVLDAARKSFPFEKKHRAQGAARQAYKAHGVTAGAVRERAPVRSGVFDGTFDFAVHNGHAVQLVQCWSFQLPNQADLAEQVKAWSWLVHEVRKEGGELSTGNGAIAVPSELDIYAIAIPPVDGAESPAYEEAKAAFTENGVTELSPTRRIVSGHRPPRRSAPPRSPPARICSRRL